MGSMKKQLVRDEIGNRSVELEFNRRMCYLQMDGCAFGDSGGRSGASVPRFLLYLIWDFH